MIFAVLLCVLLGALLIFQIALIAGAPIGHFAWGGQHRVLPARLRIGSAVSLVIYVFIGLLALDRAGAVDVFPDALSTIGMWVVVAYLTLGIALNAISRSKPERYTMVPVTVVLVALSLLVALGVGQASA